MVFGGCYEIWGHFGGFFGQNGKKNRVFCPFFGKKTSQNFFLQSFGIFPIYRFVPLVLTHNIFDFQQK